METSCKIFRFFHISQSGKHLDEKRKTAILQAPKPTTKRQMMSFLGMTNFAGNGLLIMLK